MHQNPQLVEDMRKCFHRENNTAVESKLLASSVKVKYDYDYKTMPSGDIETDVKIESISERTLVLLGKTGNGKSATGNTILGEIKFLSKRKANAITKECEMHGVKLPNGQQINVIDTPGLFSASMTQDFTIKEIVRCLTLANNRIDAVLLVISADDRFTEEEQSTLPKLKTLFGNQIVNYIIIVFTNGDKLEKKGRTLDDHLAMCPPLQEIVQECNGRKVLFDNTRKISKSKKIKQVQELINLVEEIAKKNNEEPYTKTEKELVEKLNAEESLRKLRLAKVEAEIQETRKKLSEIMQLSSAEIEKLREQLDKAEKETTSLRKKLDNSCSLL